MPTLDKEQSQTSAITEFVGVYRFLSNFYPSEVNLKFMQNLDGCIDQNNYPTVEHAYQASKTLQTSYRLKIKEAISPGAAKRLGRHIPIRRNWEEIKIWVMKHLLQQKFSPNTSLADELLKLGNIELVEGNTWGDRIWGQCPIGNGKNLLGKLLMEIRHDLQTNSGRS